MILVIMTDSYFTPIFIVIAFCIAITGLVVTNFVDGIFMDSPYRKLIQLFCLCITLNVIIFVFLVMSFSKVKFAVGPKGPRGIKGLSGYIGKDGNLSGCGRNKVSVYDARQLDRKLQELDLTPPTIVL